MPEHEIPGARGDLVNVTSLPFHPASLRKRANAFASYDTLRLHLGALTSPGDGEKCHAEWMVDTPVGPLNVYDYGDLHICRMTAPADGSAYPGGCRRNPGHRLNHDRLWTWSVQAEDDDATAWLAHLDGVRVERCKVWGVTP